ncbi:hypothetical protein [Polyangium spumosum]|uniref:Lipoprotein n=1 Tax=Polyangium spumosum TaxID=889282 RepID=A0A6N7PZW7_9BACT|nr:hypothetical protein [Polyangium spumosum]MRG97399.1 hypothetical protein [Polyangium spumosum]
MRRLLIILALAATGCGPSYYYQPAEQADASVSGHPAARYVVPPGSAKGDVRVSSFGVTDVRLSEDDEPIRSLHVRLVVANEDGEEAWAVDTRALRVQFAGFEGAAAPAFANATDSNMPVVVVPRGGSTTIDVYYPLPESLRGAKDLPQFDVIWSVRTEDRVVTQRTPFERRAIQPPPSTFAYGWGAGAYPYWWYDPFFYPRTVVVPAAPARPRVYYYGYPR